MERVEEWWKCQHSYGKKRVWRGGTVLYSTALYSTVHTVHWPYTPSVVTTPGYPATESESIKESQASNNTVALVCYAPPSLIWYFSTIIWLVVVVVVLVLVVLVVLGFCYHLMSLMGDTRTVDSSKAPGTSIQPRLSHWDVGHAIAVIRDTEWLHSMTSIKQRQQRQSISTQWGGPSLI